MTKPIRLLIVDDHPLARAGVVGMLTAYGDRFEVVAQAASCEEALYHDQKFKPDVVITDIGLCGDIKNNYDADGIALIGKIRRQRPDAKCMVLTGWGDDASLLQATDAGAMAFLLKDATADSIVRAIESVACGFSHFPQSLQMARDKRDREPKLTPTESHLMPYLANGWVPKVIGLEITASHRTIEAHIAHIKLKFGINTQLELTSLAKQYCHFNRINFDKLVTSSRKH